MLCCGSQVGTRQSVDEEEEEEDQRHDPRSRRTQVLDGRWYCWCCLAYGHSTVRPSQDLPYHHLTVAGCSRGGQGRCRWQEWRQSSRRQSAGQGLGILREALTNLYRDGGGLKAFWVGNGLNCLKIFPGAPSSSYPTRPPNAPLPSTSTTSRTRATFRHKSFLLRWNRRYHVPTRHLSGRERSRRASCRRKNAKTSLQGNALSPRPRRTCGVRWPAHLLPRSHAG